MTEGKDGKGRERGERENDAKKAGIELNSQNQMRNQNQAFKMRMNEMVILRVMISGWAALALRALNWCLGFGMHEILADRLVERCKK